MAKYNVTKISLVLNSIILSMLGIASAQYAQMPTKNEPYPTNPVGMQTYINKTVPNVAIIIDNTRTMKNKIHKGDMDTSTPSSKRPRRIDVVKKVLLDIFAEYQGQLNFSYINITDGTRDLHWKIDPTQPTGYDFAPYTDDSNMEKYTDNTYERLPFSGKTKQTTPGTARNPNASFYNNRNRALIKPVVIQEEALPETALILDKTAKKRVGKALLVPYQNMRAGTYNAYNHKQALDLAVKTTGLSIGYLQYVYPNAVEYMRNQIQYRCQDTFFLILTDGNTLSKTDNEKAAKKYAFLKGQTKEILEANVKYGIRQHPKSSKDTDKDGYPYNGLDFPDQSIRSYAIGIGTNEGSFKKFTTIGGGKSAVANSAEKIEKLMKEFVQEMLPTNTFSMTSPTGSFLYNNDASSVLMANIATETKGWVGELRFTNTLTTSTKPEQDVIMPQYLPNYAVYIASTKQGLINLGSIQAKNKLTHEDLNLKSNISIENYLKWLTAYSQKTEYLDDDTQETIEEWSGDDIEQFAPFRLRSADAQSEKRYLGDVLSSSLEMMGTMDKIISAPQYLTVGSNDGMFKIYKANPKYNEYLGHVKEPLYEDEKDDSKITGYHEYDKYDTSPYIYSFAYIPGTVEKNNGLNLLQSLVFRAAPNYSKAADPKHQYNVNGETAFRTTDKGHTFLVGTLGQGGKGAFALNIAGTDQITEQPVGLDADQKQWLISVPLWDTSTDKFGYAKKGSEALGYIVGKPVISRVALNRTNKLPNLQNNVRYIVALPSGSFGNQTIESGPTLYIYDALGVDVGVKVNNNSYRKPGELIKKITYPLTEEQQRTYQFKNSLSEATLIDLDSDGVADIGYVGDLNGNLYRLDLRSDTIADWKLELIFEGDPSRPILNAPSISRFLQKSIVIFGTGSLSRDPTSDVPHAQVLYGLMEDKTFTAHKDNPIRHDDARLIPQSITKKGDTATVTNKLPSWKGFVGWKLPLGFGQDTGESLSQKPIILNGTIFFQTHIYRNYQDKPSSDLICFKTLDGSDTWVYQINALNGGALDANSTYLKLLGNKGGIAGKKTKNTIEQPVKLIEANKSPAISKDGELLSGNDKDQILKPEASKTENFELPDENYITEEECKALLSNGMEIICPTALVKEPLHPGRISIQTLF
ncbi:MAG: PilC/PilY family type IV pilus protein [Wohlfahrtiimonas sp.]